jgi:hypothetical protein
LQAVEGDSQMIITQVPENLEPLSLKMVRQVLHELRAQQIKLRFRSWGQLLKIVNKGLTFQVVRT